ncbi:MAG: hypothetical protein WAZ19_11210 [Anaerolineae bacterium]
MAAPSLVPAPTLTPPRYGLLAAADIISDPQRWITGITHPSTARPHLAATTDLDCTPVEDPADLPDGPEWLTDDAVRVSTGLLCKLPGTTVDEMEAHARAQLTAGEGLAVEKQVWAQIMADTPATPAGSIPVSILAGIGAVEAWLYANYGGTGVLHVPRAAIPYLVKHDQVSERSGRLVTALGTAVAAGAYPATGPADAAADEGAAWMAVTAAVQVRRSDVNVRSGFDPKTNGVVAIADRYYLAGWEHLAATVQLRLEEVTP